MKQRITFITNYYPPEMGAAANRIAYMAETMVSLGYTVTVLCPLPNYPKGKIFEAYRGKNKKVSVENGVKVIRLWVYATHSANKWRRLLGMLSFSASLIAFRLKYAIGPLVFVQNSPLLVGTTGILFYRSASTKIILNVSDLWPLAGKILGNLKPGLGYRILERIEALNYSKADLILGQSKEILAHIDLVRPNATTFLYRNFPDLKLPVNTMDSEGGHMKLVYAGLLGVAQGILNLCKHIELPKNWSFYIYGEGIERTAIEAYLQTVNKQIYYKGSFSRKRLLPQLSAYDLAIVPLAKRIYGSVPSKIFEYARLGLPQIYFGGGEGGDIVLKNELGYVLPPNDYLGLNALLLTLKKDTLEPTNTLRQRAHKIFDPHQQLTALLQHLDQ